MALVVHCIGPSETDEKSTYLGPGDAPEAQAADKTETEERTLGATTEILRLTLML